VSDQWIIALPGIAGPAIHPVAGQPDQVSTRRPEERDRENPRRPAPPGEGGERQRGILGAENAGRSAYFECGASNFRKKWSFRRVLRRSGTAHGDALAVGNELRDLEAARAAGIPVGAVTLDGTAGEPLDGEDMAGGAADLPPCDERAPGTWRDQNRPNRSIRHDDAPESSTLLVPSRVTAPACR
jgi:hypothetical protein